MKTYLRFACIALILNLLAPGAFAQSAYPNKPIRFVVGYAAGSTVDILARAIGLDVSKKLGQPVIIDNRAGANGILGGSEVVRSAPDGYTVFITSSSSVTVNPLLYKKAPFDPAKDLAPVTMMVSAPFVLVVNPAKNMGMPVNTLADLIAVAKARPGEVSYGSAGLGNLAHFSMELLDERAGVKMNHIPYKGNIQAQLALLGQEIDAQFDTPGVIQQINAGKLKALAVTGAQRWPGLPNVPTIAESGYPGYETGFWIGALVPANTPAAIIKTLHEAIASTADAPEAKAAMQLQGRILMLNPQEFAARIKSEIVLNSEINKIAKVQFE